MVLAALLALLSPRAMAQNNDPLKIEPSPLIEKLLKDAALSEAEKRELAVFHGRGSTLEEPTVAEQAAIALQRHELDHPALADASVPPLVRAEAALSRGEPSRVLELLEKDASAQGTLLRAKALEHMGRDADAVAALVPLRERMKEATADSAAELTAGAEGLALLARLEGRPAQDYRLIMSLLGKARDEIDRLYWPAHLAEARVLMEKNNNPEAAEAAVDALRLNPSAGEGWYILGRILTDGFDFDRVGRCVAELKKINPAHPLAELLQAQMFLAQRDPNSARSVLAAFLERFPEHREALALAVAAEAISYNDEAFAAAMAKFESLSPNSPLAFATAGHYLSAVRQYKPAEEMLRQAIARRPNWAEPRTELGLMLMQAGEESKAKEELHAATKLDPFNFRAINQLKLVGELETYGEIETDHFIIRYKPGIDEALARDMPEVLEKIYRDVTAAFRHEPDRKTLIEILPNEQWFAVRITGMPDIWTIAACTGDVIALTPPREGPGQHGTFDWPRVLRHEYVHTVTLSQTANRIPHWFTEACAVSQEPNNGRDYNVYRLLAGALQNDKLFTLDSITWGFVRPKGPNDRSLAYAQSNWMLEYITRTYGHDAVVELLKLYRTGTPDGVAMQKVTGKTPDEFLDGFKAWAREQVKEWGLAKGVEDARIVKLLSGSAPPDPAEVNALLSEYPEHPDLLFLAADRAVRGKDHEAARQAVLRYAAARPVDPWSHRALVALATKTGRPEEAIGSLEELDQSEQSTGAWAFQLAQVYRAAGQFEQAGAAVERAVHREPYNGTYRETAAAIHIQAGDNETALRHLTAMTLIEPDKALHHQRQATLLKRMGRDTEADAAMKRIEEMNAPTTQKSD